MLIPQNMLDKYHMPTLDVFLETWVDENNDKESVTCGYYEDFLHRTNHIPNEIIEGSITSEEVLEELYYREVSRIEMNKYLGKEVAEAKPNITVEQRTSENEKLTASILGSHINKKQSAEQTRRVLQMFAQTLSDEQAMEVATVYPAYVAGKLYKEKEMFTYGVNEVGDPQLYRVVSEHTSQEDWIPDTLPALYTPIGLNEEGYPVWSQPTGAQDAYMIGDIVDYNGTLYKSLIDGNTYSPEAYPAGWEVYTA